MTTKITFPMMARFGLMRLIGEHVPPRDVAEKFEHNLVFFGIQKKIHVPNQLRVEIQAALPTKGDDAFIGYTDLTVELESGEIQKLIKLIREAEVPVAFCEWLIPVMQQLRTAEDKAYTAASQSTAA